MKKRDANFKFGLFYTLFSKIGGWVLLINLDSLVSNSKLSNLACYATVVNRKSGKPW